MKGKIMIVGGYGAIGSILSEQLAKHFPQQVIVAGRSKEKAAQLARQLNDIVIPYAFDVKQHAQALPGDVCMVIMCIDQEDTRFVAHCLNKGIHYIDITASNEFMEQVALLDDTAQQHAATVVLSVGLAPGVSNLLARYCSSKNPAVSEIDIFVLLGLGERHGTAAYQWICNNLHSSYTLRHKDRPVILKSFSDPVNTNLKGERKFFLFNFSDQHALLRTTPLKRVQTRMAFDSSIFTRGLALFRQLSITKLLRSSTLQRGLIRLFHKFSWGTDVYGIKVVGNTPDGANIAYSITGYGEGKITAYVTTEIALQVLQQAPKPGIYHSHEIIKDIPAFLQRLQQYDQQISLIL